MGEIKSSESYKAFAEHILQSEKISDKLIFPENLTDSDRSSFDSDVTFPSRETSLKDAEKIAFPAVDDFSKDDNAGIVMHFFANHELLAIELMALLLLKFPDAPDKFRQDIIKTIKEEQEHMSLYLNRMNDFGISFGDIPASDMFWRTISTMETPMDFVCRMGLTFEQANLDYCLYYEDIFKRIDDHKTAGILRRVYEDEVGHVISAYHWFKQWKDKDLSEWDVYQQHLNFPLTAQRAKGKVFYDLARKAVGLEPELVKAIKLYTHSKGRTPNLYLFNPEAELDIAGIPLNKTIDQLKADLSGLMAFIAKKDDIVLVKSKPDQAYLEHLSNLEIDYPQFISETELLQTERKLNRFKPWASSPALDQIIAPISNQFSQTNNSWNKDYQKFYDKIEQQQLQRQLLSTYKHPKLIDENTLGFVCDSLESITEAADSVQEKGFEKMIIKGRFGASGNQNLIQSLDKEIDHERVTKLLKNQGKVIVEPYYNKLIDFSFQFEVNKNQDIKFLGLTRFKTDSNGKYQGHYLGKFDHTIEPDLVEFLRFKSTKQISFIDELVVQIIQLLKYNKFNLLHSGPFSVDAMILKDKAGYLKLHPFLEINPRYNMGYVSLQLSKHFRHRKMFKLISMRDVNQNGFATFSDFLKSNDHLIGISDFYSAKQVIAVLE